MTDGLSTSYAITTSTSGRTNTIHASGELDLAAIAHFEAILGHILDEAGGGEIRVDLAEVTFIDSSAIGALIKGKRVAGERGRAMIVINARDRVREIMQISAVLDLLSRADTPDGAGS